MSQRRSQTLGRQGSTDTPSAQPESPRARLRERGAGALSDTEVLALLLRTGGREASALEVARNLLHDLGGLGGLVGSSPAGFRGCRFTEPKATVLLAALELARRLARLSVPERKPMTRPGEVAAYLALKYFERDQEVTGALFVDSRNRLMAIRELYRGGLNRAYVEPRAILRAGLLLGAGGVIVFHTHPSGDPSPSVEDLAFTRRMADAGEAVGIGLLDHFIIAGPSRWVSLRQRGGW